MPLALLIRSLRSAGLFAVALAAALTLPCARAAFAGETIEGFSEPNRTINIATPEFGIVVDVLVREGQDVSAGQPLARLDDDLLQAQLAIARQQMEATGRLKAALAELQMCEKRLQKLLELSAAGAAHREEVERARADKEAAEGRAIAEREERELLRLQYEKLKVQIARRTITAPVTGKVAEILKRPGEGLSPSDVGVARLVELDPLRAVFLMKRPQAEKLRIGQPVKVVFAYNQAVVDAKIEYISAVTDAESETVTVKAVMSNPEGKLHSGERCVLQLDR